MKQQIAASLLACAFVLAPAAFAADRKTDTDASTLRFTKTLSAVFSEAAEHNQVTRGEQQMVIAANPSPNVLVARKNLDGSVTIGCFNNGESALRFVAAPHMQTPAQRTPPAQQTPAAQRTPEVK